MGKNRIRSYAYRLSSGTDPKDPQPLHGFSWDIRLTGQNATISDHEVDAKKMHSILVGFNRIFEFSDNTGRGLQQEDTKHLDPINGRLWAGRDCDIGKTKSSQHEGQNCVHQDFFLDNFELAKLDVKGNNMMFTYRSDLQGTSPWCGKDKPDCANPPGKKPTLTFSVASDGGSFKGSKLNIVIENFPFKHSNSSLALGASIFATTVAPHISQQDETSAVTSADGIDCKTLPLPEGCPTVDMGANTHFNWVKYVTDTKTGHNNKVVTTHPTRVKSGAVGSDGERLIQKRMFFSFKHGMSRKLLWDPELEAEPSTLPRNLKSAAPSGALPTAI